MDEIERVLDREICGVPEFKDYSLSFTGHSLGAALATVAGTVMASRNKTSHKFKEPITILSFASPRVAGYDFHKYHRALEAGGHLRHVRFMNYDDVVPTIPLASVTSLSKYVHVGARVVLGKPETNPIQNYLIDYPDLENSKRFANVVSYPFCGTGVNPHFTWHYLSRIKAAIDDAVDDTFMTSLTIPEVYARLFAADGTLTPVARGIGFYSPEYLQANHITVPELAAPSVR